MSARADALRALDDLTSHEWLHFAPRNYGRRREEFRKHVADGRVDYAAVIANAATARECQRLYDLMGACLMRLQPMPVGKIAEARPALKVVGR